MAARPSPNSETEQMQDWAGAVYIQHDPHVADGKASRLDNQTQKLNKIALPET